MEFENRLVGVYQCREKSFIFLLRVFAEYFRGDHSSLDKLKMVPLCYSPVRFLADKYNFLLFVKQCRHSFNLTWEEAYLSVSDIFFCCSGFLVFYYECMFSSDNDSFTKFLKFKENGLNKLTTKAHK